MTALTKNELEDVVKILKEIRGNHTELITALIPAGYDVNSVQKQLEAEKSTAKNIKSTATRKNVIEALEKIVRQLKEYKKTPENGLAVYCGNVSKDEGSTDMQIWTIEPPQPLQTRTYRCDKEFIIEPLEKMLEVEELYALLVMDRKEATVGLLNGKQIEVIQKMTSGIPSKVRAGGQSSQRFHRITEGLTRDFYKRIAEEMKKAFFELPRLKGILVGGPMPTKDEFLDNEYLQTQLQEKVIGRVDLGDTDESGLGELVERSQDILAEQEIIKEKKLLTKFFEILGKTPDMAVYKPSEIKKALQYGAVEIVLMSRNLDKDIFEDIKTKAENISAQVEIISDETEEAHQFQSITNGVGAILRFKTG